MTALTARIARLEGRAASSGSDTVRRDAADFDAAIAALATRAGTNCEDMPDEEIMRREAAFDAAFAAMEVPR